MARHDLNERVLPPADIESASRSGLAITENVDMHVDWLRAGRSLEFVVHLRRSPFTVHRSPFVVRRSPFVVRRSSFTGHEALSSRQPSDSWTPELLLSAALW